MIPSISRINQWEKPIKKCFSTTICQRAKKNKTIEGLITETLKNAGIPKNATLEQAYELLDHSFPNQDVLSPQDSLKKGIEVCKRSICVFDNSKRNSLLEGMNIYEKWMGLNQKTTLNEHKKMLRIAFPDQDIKSSEIVEIVEKKVPDHQFMNYSKIIDEVVQKKLDAQKMVKNWILQEIETGNKE